VDLDHGAARRADVADRPGGVQACGWRVLVRATPPPSSPTGVPRPPTSGGNCSQAELVAAIAGAFHLTAYPEAKRCFVLSRSAIKELRPLLALSGMVGKFQSFTPGSIPATPEGAAGTLPVRLPSIVAGELQNRSGGSKLRGAGASEAHARSIRAFPNKHADYLQNRCLSAPRIIDRFLFRLRGFFFLERDSCAVEPLL